MHSGRGMNRNIVVFANQNCSTTSHVGRPEVQPLLGGAIGNRPRWACPNGALTGQLLESTVLDPQRVVSDAPCRRERIVVIAATGWRQGASET